MANEYFNDKVHVIGGGRACIMGKFQPNGAGVINNLLNQGRGWSVARTAAGTYAVTLRSLYVQDLALNATAQLSTPADIKMQVTSYTPATGVVVLTALAVAAATDIAAAAGNWVNFEFWFRHSQAI